MEKYTSTFNCKTSNTLKHVTCPFCTLTKKPSNWRNIKLTFNVSTLKKLDRLNSTEYTTGEKGIVFDAENVYLTKHRSNQNNSTEPVNHRFTEYTQPALEVSNPNVATGSDSDDGTTMAEDAEVHDTEDFYSDNEVYSSCEEDFDDEADINQGFLLNTILPIAQSFENISAGAGVANVEDDMDRLHYASSVMDEMDDIPAMSNPFDYPLQGLIHGFFYGDEDLKSERMVKKIHYLLEVTLKLQKASKVPLVLPAPDRIFNFLTMVKPKIPGFAPVERKARNKKGEEHSFFMNEPSVYLEHLVATPGMTKKMATCDDLTYFLIRTIIKITSDTLTSYI
ncbi:uncharacterized protein EV154DRAFT_486901 [Mucor mucedo]|uniref:uncharacterized protein n=1 Tax=Mucor mucedo TaxID=29922 RepID=UPI0022208567|nr:uncharacterized protein EV154DRAFT_486901 [Mucor mucedo]KAI7874437.1 hypothetical protein EV154DRAFT_486901 [Mucor mucedo]